MGTKGKMLIGALIGFASGLFVASTLFTALFSGSSFAISLGKESFIFVFLVIVSVFSFFGVHCMLDNNQPKNEEELGC